jgi:PAS domain S-box-containing protein
MQQDLKIPHTPNDIVEETAPGIGNMDRTWMLTFWEMFTECVIETDARFIITNIRRKADSTFTEANVVGRLFLDFVVDKDRAFVASELELLKSAGMPYRRFTFLSKQGRYYRWTLMVIHKDGVFSGICGIAVDTTEQSQKEITLNWQRAIIEGSSNLVCISDMNGYVLYTNPGAYRMTRHDPATGPLPLELIFTAEHLETVRGKGLEKAIESGSWTGLGGLVRADGEIVPIEHDMFSVKNDQGDVILIATIIRDITVFMEHEKELEQARQAAEIASTAKSEFLSRMSHEIRTPLNAIIGMINIGIGSDDIGKKDYCFEGANKASKHLLGIINDILDMSKIEADKFELSYNEFDIVQTLKNVTNMANVPAEEKKLNFIVNLGDDASEYIFGDELRLSQVITNLLSNAIKFTPEKGTVTLNVKKTKRKDDIFFKFEVSDTGIGISKEQQERLFMSFNQADSSISRKFGGTGLGLAISKRIVELMGGEIWLESELGKGAKFIFTLTTERIERTETSESPDGAQREAPKQRCDFSGHTILIAEDVEINREIMSAILEDTNVSIDYAENGKMAVSMFNSSPEKYSLILMDINMPEMDGYEATRQIRSLDPAKAKDIPIIAMTANVFNEDIQKCLTAGMNDHTGKPIDAIALLRQLNKYLAN